MWVLLFLFFNKETFFGKTFKTLFTNQRKCAMMCMFPYLGLWIIMRIFAFHPPQTGLCGKMITELVSEKGENDGKGTQTADHC